MIRCVGAVPPGDTSLTDATSNCGLVAVGVGACPERLPHGASKQAANKAQRSIPAQRRDERAVPADVAAGELVIFELSLVGGAGRRGLWRISTRVLSALLWTG